MSTQIIGFHKDRTKIMFQLSFHQICTLFLFLQQHVILLFILNVTKSRITVKFLKFGTLTNFTVNTL